MCRVGFNIMPVEGAGWSVLRTYIGFHLVMIKDNIKIFQVKNYIQRPNRWCNDKHGHLECGTFVYRGFDRHLSQTNDNKSTNL